MIDFLKLLKEEIKKQIFSQGWIVKQLHGLSSGLDISYDISNRLGIVDLRTIFDCGAHNGETAIDFKNKFPSAQIYSFEPVSKNFITLKKNTSMYPQIHCYHFALGDKEETVKIQLQSDSQTHSLNNIELSENSINTEIISVKTIDDFLLSSKIDNIDLLKIDTEGYELQVLKGAEQSLKNNKIKLILAESTIQSDDKFHTNLNTLNRYLENYNFKITAIYDQVIWRNPTRLSYFNVLFSKQ